MQTRKEHASFRHELRAEHGLPHYCAPRSGEGFRFVLTGFFPVLLGFLHGLPPRSAPLHYDCLAANMLKLGLLKAGRRGDVEGLLHGSARESLLEVVVASFRSPFWATWELRRSLL